MTTAIEDVIHGWVTRSSGFAPEKVIWENQEGTRPTDPFVTIRIGDQRTHGAFDQYTETVDLNRPAGEETECLIEGWREFTVSIQAYTHTVTGDDTASEVLTRIQACLGLPTYRDELAAAEVTPSFERGTVRNVPALLGTSRFESRAIVDINFYRIARASEFVGYIAEIHGEGTISGTVDPDTGIVDFDADAS